MWPVIKERLTVYNVPLSVPSPLVSSLQVYSASAHLVSLSYSTLCSHCKENYFFLLSFYYLFLLFSSTDSLICSFALFLVARSMLPPGRLNLSFYSLHTVWES